MDYRLEYLNHRLEYLNHRLEYLNVLYHNIDLLIVPETVYIFAAM